MNDNVIWCEDCQHLKSPDMGGEADCSVWGLHTWYGRSIGYCPYFKRKKKEGGRVMSEAVSHPRGGVRMTEAVREMTYDEQVADFIINILAIETPFGVKRDLISHILSLSYRHERDIKDALYTPTPSCSFKAEEGE